MDQSGLCWERSGIEDVLLRRCGAVLPGVERYC